MAGDLIQHVVEKGDTGFTVEPPLAIEIDGNRNLGLLGITGDGGDSLGHVDSLLRSMRHRIWARYGQGALSGRASRYACRHGPLIIENRSPHPLQCAIVAAAPSRRRGESACR